jgi:hypothetical protein
MIELNARQLVVSAHMRGWTYVWAPWLLKSVSSDMDAIDALVEAERWGLEIRGYVPHHIWMGFLNRCEKAVAS